MSLFHDQFAADPDFEDWYHWQTKRPVFQSDRVKFLLWEDGQCFEEDTSEIEQTIQVTAVCENGNGFADYQEKCWEYIENNASQIEKDLRRKLWAICRENFEAFESQLEDDDPVWDSIQAATDWEKPSALEVQVMLSGITLYDDGFDEVGFCTFDFEVGWDEEHGTSVLMHKDRVIAATGSGDFCNRGSSLLAHAKYIQRYDLIEGDCQLDG